MKKIICLVTAILMLFGITVYGIADTGKKKPVVGKKPTSHYPITITTYNYSKNPVKLTFKKAPERVVAVYQNSIETLLALGLEKKIVLGAGLDDAVKPEFKAAFSQIKYLEKAPSKEDVLALKPDFILSWYSFFGEKKLGDIGFWNERGINTYISQNSGLIQPNSLQNEYDDILNMGKIFNVEDRANKIVSNMKNEIKKAKAFVKGKNTVRTVILEVEKDGVYRIYGADSIGGDIAKQVGANLVADKNGKIGNEDLIKLNPDVVFSVYYGKEIERDEALSKIMKNPALASVSAVRTKRVHPIVLSEVYASGVRTLDGIKTISKGLYPELYK